MAWYNIDMTTGGCGNMGVALALHASQRCGSIPPVSTMNDLLLKIEYEIYWLNYLPWVYSESPIERKPKSIYEQRYENLFKEND